VTLAPADRGAVERAVAAVEDPEYPGVTIADLGILEDVRVDRAGAGVEVDLLPTRIGCPALEMIRADVEAAARSVPGVQTVTVRFRHDPPWTPDRITAKARGMLARELTIAVPVRGAVLRCPVCGSGDVEPVTEVGSAPCRSVARCRACRNPLEVVRR